MAFSQSPVFDLPVDLPVNLPVDHHSDTDAMLASLGLGATDGVPLTIPLDAPLPALALPIRKKTPRAAPATGLASFGPDPDVLDTFAAATPDYENNGGGPRTRRAAAPLPKQKEGSRQRRRWENDRLLHVPNVQPPLPSDWEVRPTHPVRNNLPYHIAHVWDTGLRRHVHEARAAAAVRRRQQFVERETGTTAAASSPGTTSVGLITRELRTAAKKVPAVKTWVRVLEEPIRAFAVQSSSSSSSTPIQDDNADADAAYAARLADSVHSLRSDTTVVSAAATDDTTDYASVRAATAATAATATAPSVVSAFSGDEDDGEDEIVFVGRRPVRARTVSVASAVSATSFSSTTPPMATATATGIVLGSLPGADRGDGSFQRWLIHSVSEYYGLVSQSATLGMPPRRAVYVTRGDERTAGLVPRPMWEVLV